MPDARLLDGSVYRCGSRLNRWRMLEGLFPEDRLRRIGPATGRPGPIMPSDKELLVREVQLLKAEILKIKKALKKHGIEVE